MKRIFSVFLIVCLLFGLSACKGKDKTADKVISVVLSQKAKNIDPQLAGNTAETLAALNCFEGLFKIDKDNKPVLAAAESYTCSNDGKTYTIAVKKGLKWSDDITPVTAADFVFGIRRALRYDTKSPYAAMLFDIKNAKAVHSGQMVSSDLGISAPDEYTVKIVLENANRDFPRVLASSAAMPCNESFFTGTKGKYGLTEDTILSNGPFYVRAWNLEKGTIRLSRMESYSGSVKPAGVSISYQKDAKTVSSALETGSADIGPVSYTDMTKLKTFDFNEKSFYNTAYSVYLNLNIENADNSRLNHALITSIDRGAIAMNLPNYFKPIDSLLPESVLVHSENYRKNVGAADYAKYKPEEAKELFQNEANQPKVSISALTFYYPETDLTADLAMLCSRLVQDWQKSFGISINTKAVPESELKTLIQSGECQMGLIPVSSKDGTAQSALYPFMSGGENNKTGYENAGFDKAMAAASPQNDVLAFCDALRTAENILLASDHYYPLFEVPIYYAVSQTVSDLQFSASGDVVYFSAASKQSD